MECCTFYNQNGTKIFNEAICNIIHTPAHFSALFSPATELSLNIISSMCCKEKLTYTYF